MLFARLFNELLGGVHSTQGHLSFRELVIETECHEVFETFLTDACHWGWLCDPNGTAIRHVSAYTRSLQHVLFRHAFFFLDLQIVLLIALKALVLGLDTKGCAKP